MLPTATARTRVVTYLVLTFALSSIFYWQIAGAGKPQAGEAVVDRREEVAYPDLSGG